MLKGTQTGTNNYLVKQLPIATAFLNRKLEVVHASDKWIECFNFPDRDVFGKKIFTLFKGEHKNWQKVLNDCLKGKVAVNGKERFFNTEMNDRLFEWTNVPWYDERENVIGVIIQTEDVTEKVNHELNLEQQHLLFNEKSEIANIGSWNLDFINQELAWSDITRRIHEVPLDFKPNMDTAIDFYKQGHSRNTISMAVERAMTEGIAFSERLQIITAKGNEKWVIASGRPIFKNEIFLGLLGTLQDINEEVQADIKTKENEQLLKTLIDNLPLNVFIKDLDSKKVLVNKSECEYLGVKNANEILGKNDFDLYGKETAQISRDEDLQVINSLTSILGKETKSVKKDGTVTTFLTSKIPLIGDDGVANGLIGISLDITRLKQKEEELRDLINVTSMQNKKLINFAHIVSHNLRSHSANFSMLLDFLVNEQNGNERENLTKMLVEASDNLLETLGEPQRSGGNQYQYQSWTKNQRCSMKPWQR